MIGNFRRVTLWPFRHWLSELRLTDHIRRSACVMVVAILFFLILTPLAYVFSVMRVVSWKQSVRGGTNWIPLSSMQRDFASELVRILAWILAVGLFAISPTISSRQQERRDKEDFEFNYPLY